MLISDIPNINAEQIMLFLSIADTKSFSKSAEIMHYEQSTLSRKVSQLEQTLGIELFDRGLRPIQLTKKGKILYDEWRQIMLSFEKSIVTAKKMGDDDAKNLSVCVIDSTNLMLDIPTINREMRERYEDVSIYYNYLPFSKWPELMEEGKIDLVETVFFDALDRGEQFVTEEIVLVPKLACVTETSPLAKKDKITYEDIRDYKFITIDSSETTKHKDFITRQCAKHGFVPTFGRMSMNAAGLFSALQNDDEVLMCDIFLRGYNDPNFKTFVLPDTYSTMCVAYLAENKNPNIPLFIRQLKKYYRNKFPMESVQKGIIYEYDIY